MKKDITWEKLKNWRDDFESDPMAKYLQNSLVRHDLKEVYTNRDALLVNQLCFPDNPKIGDVMAQKQSGRCWMFAELNVLRSELMRKKEMPETFRFSVPYLYFFDKLERANFFLERILMNKGRNAQGEIDRFMFYSPLGEGGQWYMMVNLIEKYGMVPERCMPETYHSENTQQFCAVLNKIVRNGAVQIINNMESGADEMVLLQIKEKCLASVYEVLCGCLGTPPEKFRYEYKDTKGEYHMLEMTPQEFANDFCECHFDDYVYVVDVPGKNRPYHKTFTLENCGNIWGKNGLYYNLSMEEIKPMLLAQLADGETIWFGCDCMNDMDRASGMMIDGLYDYQGLFGVEYELSREEMLDYCESGSNHDMVISAVKETSPGHYVWKVENSWGSQVGIGGRYVMDDSFLEKYAFQFVINKKHMTETQLFELEQEPIVLKSNDPMGI